MRFARRRWHAALAATLVAGTLAIGGAGSAQVPAGVRIDLKMLLITGNPSGSTFEAWVDLLDREQVPYDVVDASVSAQIHVVRIRRVRSADVYFVPAAGIRKIWSAALKGDEAAVGRDPGCSAAANALTAVRKQTDALGNVEQTVPHHDVLRAVRVVRDQV